ncbi:hypothetical protein IV102_02645 [bacterium]|nr:hypothetical protein [bacterium]
MCRLEEARPATELGSTEAAAELLAAEAAASAAATGATHAAAHLSHQAVHFAHQFLHFGGHLALLKASLEGVLGSTGATLATGATEVACQRVAVGAATAAAGDGTETTRATGLGKCALGAGKSLSHVVASAESAGEAHSDTHRSTSAQIVVYSINFTHEKSPRFRNVLRR